MSEEKKTINDFILQLVPVQANIQVYAYTIIPWQQTTLDKLATVFYALVWSFSGRRKPGDKLQTRLCLLHASYLDIIAWDIASDNCTACRSTHRVDSILTAWLPTHENSGILWRLDIYLKMDNYIKHLLKTDQYKSLMAGMLYIYTKQNNATMVVGHIIKNSQLLTVST